MDITALVQASLPAVFALIRSRHAEVNPGAPPLTDEQIFASLHDYISSEVAQNAAIAADIRKRRSEA